MLTRQISFECVHCRLPVTKNHNFGQILTIVADYSVSPAPCILTLLRIRVDMI